MPSTPCAGWTELSIGDWRNRASYLSDVPMILLKTMEEAIRLRMPKSCVIDAENYEYIMVFDQEHTFVITNSEDGPDYHTFTDIPLGWLNAELGKQLVSDIRKDITRWAEWGDYGDMSDDQKTEREKDLLCLCDVVEKRHRWWVQ